MCSYQNLHDCNRCVHILVYRHVSRESLRHRNGRKQPSLHPSLSVHICVHIYACACRHVCMLVNIAHLCISVYTSLHAMPPHTCPYTCLFAHPRTCPHVSLCTWVGYRAAGMLAQRDDPATVATLGYVHPIHPRPRATYDRTHEPS